MKKIILLAVLTLANCLISKLVHCQTLSPSVLPSSGGYYSNANGSLSFTIGETIIPTLTAGSNMLTQGFQQPEVQVSVGTVVTSLCQGAAISVPFTASGIISASNMFTAQLSNASGSFASPITIGTLIGNSSGIINATIPIATPLGTGYRIRVLSSLPSFTGPNNGSNISITNTCSVIVNLTLFIEGYYLGAGLMNNVLQNQTVVGATVTQTDTITVELRNIVFPFGIAATLNTILNTNGTAICNFPTAGTFYLAVKHRNGLQTWSANPITISAIPISYNFSDAANKAYGSNQVSLGAGVFGIYSGDFNDDENIDLLDIGILEDDINLFSFGYFATDINGDGNVDLLDVPIVEANVNAFIFSNHP